MSKVLVAGFIQVETIVNVEQIPIRYKPVRSKPNTIFTSVGGDAYNTSLALTWLGNSVDFISMIGKANDRNIINPHGSEIELVSDYVLPLLSETPTAVIFYDEDKQQQIFEDIKNIREISYDLELCEYRLQRCELVVLSNANFCRPFIAMAKEYKKKLAINIREYKAENLVYNRDFLEAADIIYVSDDNLTEDPYVFVRELADNYDPEIIILGQGNKGVILYSKNDSMLAHFNSVRTNEIINTVGAGNALFSCFLHYYTRDQDATNAIKKALLFASYKIGFVGTSNGFMTEEQIDQWNGLIWK